MKRQSKVAKSGHLSENIIMENWILLISLNNPINHFLDRQHSFMSNRQLAKISERKLCDGNFDLGGLTVQSS